MTFLDRDTKTSEKKIPNIPYWGGGGVGHQVKYDPFDVTLVKPLSQCRQGGLLVMTKSPQ